MGFSALNALRYASLSRSEAQQALEQLETLLNTASPTAHPPHQTLIVLRALVWQNEDQH